MEKIELTAGPDASGRLDAWLAGQCAELSRSALQNLMEQGRVTRGGQLRQQKRQSCPRRCLLYRPAGTSAHRGPAPEHPAGCRLRG